MARPGRIVAIGASAGGLEPLVELLRVLPAKFDAPVVVAVHAPPESLLTEVLEARDTGGLTICKAQDGDLLEAGTVYVVPGGTHAFVREDRIEIRAMKRNSGFRPSIDALFMSLAASRGEQAIAVVLSGSMNDGMRGSQMVYDLGGITLVQDPDEADYAEMPQNVIRRDHPRHILKAEELGQWLADLIAA